MLIINVEICHIIPSWCKYYFPIMFAILYKCVLKIKKWVNFNVSDFFFIWTLCSFNTLVCTVRAIRLKSSCLQTISIEEKIIGTGKLKCWETVFDYTCPCPYKWVENRNYFDKKFIVENFDLAVLILYFS